MYEEALEFIPLTFAALLPIINPVGTSLIFLNIVGPAQPVVFRKLAWRIALSMLVFIAVIEVFGALLLKFFGISLPVLQVSGGLTLAAMGWSMLNAKEESETEAASVGHDEQSLLGKVFYPLTFPLTVGPGAIVVIVTMSAHASGHDWELRMLAHAAIFVAVVLVAVLVYLCFAYAPRLSRLMPKSVANGIQRLVSFILLCIGVQIAWGGFDSLLGTLVHAH
ncbi:MAG TPA: MarC family protein [Dokdonella sp.]|uniref:MarC family protein n=1 Tax=Dokdonella sp. TaxID=2291710 RepID=UPI002D7EE5AF|nr:MarC family protein [Dokdonella sp.]HET9033516.1 MarC family protein [Dokdonella sp.]